MYFRILVFMSTLNFMLSWFEFEKRFNTEAWLVLQNWDKSLTSYWYLCKVNFCSILSKVRGSTVYWPFSNDFQHLSAPDSALGRHILSNFLSSVLKYKIIINYPPVSSADSLCKQLGTRSGLTFLSGLIWIQTIWLWLYSWKNLWKIAILKKNINRRQKSLTFSNDLQHLYAPERALGGQFSQEFLVLYNHKIIVTLYPFVSSVDNLCKQLWPKLWLW